MIGGSATIRSSPSTTPARLASTRVLSRERAFATMSSWARASRLLTRLTRDLLADQLEQLAGFQVLVPGLQTAHPGRAAHPVPVLAHAGHDDRAPVRGGEPAVAAQDLEAGREPLDVPLPRTGQRLVEVVDVEQHPPLRGAEQAEVRQVGVAAQLHGDAGPGRAGQVGGHDGRRAAEERERRHEHPAVPDRDEFRHPRHVPAVRAARSGPVGPAPAATGRDRTAAHRRRAARPRATRSSTVSRCRRHADAKSGSGGAHRRRRSIAGANGRSPRLRSCSSARPRRPTPHRPDTIVRARPGAVVIRTG